MFGTVSATPYDLQFSLFGIPVRISIWFWLAGAILGYNALKAGAAFLIGWLLVLLVSILIHELGHALAARCFGYSPSILLYQFGGLAFYNPAYGQARWKSILISLAGPGAGFILAAVIYAFAAYALPQFYFRMEPAFQELVSFILGQLLFVNVIWGLVNLLPVLPLDGGRVCQEICSSFAPYRGTLYAAWIGVIVGGLAAAYFFTQKDNYPAFLFLMLAFTNFNIIQEWRERSPFG